MTLLLLRKSRSSLSSPKPLHKCDATKPGSSEIRELHGFETHLKRHKNFTGSLERISSIIIVDGSWPLLELEFPAIVSLRSSIFFLLLLLCN
ncbi:hypothetical protein GBA52_014436 [Prunus armeniaca]|nr:hypothetical protein GBA52_014436 [Prunus armeniaca]